MPSFQDSGGQEVLRGGLDCSETFRGRLAGRYGKEVIGRATGSSSASVLEAAGKGETAPPAGRSEMGGDEIFEKYGSAVFIITLTEGMIKTQGSGFFISPDGLAVSNYHVFKGSKKGSESITLADGKSYKVKEVIGKGNCDGNGLRPDDYMLFRVDIGSQSVNYILWQKNWLV